MAKWVRVMKIDIIYLGLKIGVIMIFAGVVGNEFVEANKLVSDSYNLIAGIIICLTVVCTFAGFARKSRVVERVTMLSACVFIFVFAAFEGYLVWMGYLGIWEFLNRLGACEVLILTALLRQRLNELFFKIENKAKGDTDDNI